ncbi:MAG: phytoene dehydrogenase, partial [Burkholderiales bacterium PBB5]
IGAYRQTLALMRSVGADPQRLLQRLPLTLRYPDGHGLQLPPGAPLPAFVRGVLAARGWGWADRLALLAAAGGWLLRGFACPADWTVARLCRRLPAAVRRDLVEPLCVAALNTPMAEASAAVFLTVLRDALFSGSGSADLLLPRQPLAALLPSPALAWLVQHGAQIQLAHRAGQLSRTPSGWQVDGWAVDAVLL